MSRNKIIVTVALVLLAVFFISGCGTQVSTGANGEPRLIQTYGEAEVKGAPDLARISLAVTTISNSAEKAVEENARLASAVVEALKGFGLSDGEIKTSSYQLYNYREWYDGRPAEEEVITYQVTNEVIVTTIRLDEVGELIDLAVKAGANNINFISFELDNPQELQIQALKLATEQAELKADAIAESAGEKISGLYRIREERSEYMPNIYRQEVSADMGMGDTTPIMPEEVVLRAMVTAEFAF
ncbi:MAG: SIMPL domain-containing protein [Dethiobacteria bacterium]|nr:SIMPL domain-containing protein [Dethiobacteria bacterium]